MPLQTTSFPDQSDGGLSGIPSTGVPGNSSRLDIIRTCKNALAPGAKLSP